MRNKAFMIIVLAFIFCFSSIISTAAAAEKPKTAPAKGQPAAVKAPPPNSVTQNVMKAGVRTCANRVNQVTNFLAAGAKGVGYSADVSKNNPDQHMTSVTMEIPLKDTTAYASANFAPAQGNYCAGIYETVVYWPKNCKEVGDKQFSKFKKAAPLSRNIQVREISGAAKVYLMPAGSGCVAIKKEIVR